ncbi:hypothetical protein BCR33DRAFT_767849 [Rhizoclosmatium globosum]|uniref:Uncharacterized protein n=1 Tax=Rhizoclosmatium globosum TaxID=329046 RepID=A0A1Y2C0W6_9FUNG|nr:hypothetical protein BCR33DRAFT_767849 [Rhizoclosmatium globosum]|eukprot:ORY40659.1 hypothetical protein BCR33DRAFT_767849 [Rhizoclosmatium globosum]
MSERLFKLMVSKVDDIVTVEWKMDWSEVHLVSSGAAWADHSAVSLFLLNPNSKLTLHFPCRFLLEQSRIEDNGSSDWRKNPGRTANQYHERFSRALNLDSMAQISEAIKAGAVVATEAGGFHARNSKIAQQTKRLIAFTWSTGKTPEKSGWDAGYLEQMQRTTSSYWSTFY